MMVCIHRRFLNPRGVFINSGEHSFSAQTLIKRHGASWNSPPSHPSLLKIHVGAATRSHFPERARSILPYLNNNERERRVLGNRTLIENPHFFKISNLLSTNFDWQEVNLNTSEDSQDSGDWGSVSEVGLFECFC